MKFDQNSVTARVTEDVVHRFLHNLTQTATCLEWIDLIGRGNYQSQD